MQLIIVEDNGYRDLLPLAATRPVFDILCGSLSLAERINRYMPSKAISYIFRNELREVFGDRYPIVQQDNQLVSDCLYVNGRVLWDDLLSKNLRRIVRDKRNTIIRCDQDWVALYYAIPNVMPTEMFSTVPVYTPDGFTEEFLPVRVISYPWDIIDSNPDYIAKDFKFRTKRNKNKIKGRVHSRAVLNPKKDIFIGSKTLIGPYVVIDASTGPVMIEDAVTVQPHVFIQGPVWINSETIIKSGARIYGGTSIGYNCRAAGEITSSIMHGYTNKAHDGFLGHSYLGQWINIGADTNNSNLKNNYGSIQVVINGKSVETGRQFFGMVMGDHSRTGINTMINTGTIIGTACNIFGANYPQRYIPDFSWGGSELLRLYRFDKFLQNAKAMTERRGVTLSEEEIQLLRTIYESRKSK